MKRRRSQSSTTEEAVSNGASNNNGTTHGGDGEKEEDQNIKIRLDPVKGTRRFQSDGGGRFQSDGVGRRSLARFAGGGGDDDGTTATASRSSVVVVAGSYTTVEEDRLRLRITKTNRREESGILLQRTKKNKKNRRSPTTRRRRSRNAAFHLAATVATAMMMMASSSAASAATTTTTTMTKFPRSSRTAVAAAAAFSLSRTTTTTTAKRSSQRSLQQRRCHGSSSGSLCLCRFLGSPSSSSPTLSSLARRRGDCRGILGDVDAASTLSGLRVTTRRRLVGGGGGCGGTIATATATTLRMALDSRELRFYGSSAAVAAVAADLSRLQAPPTTLVPPPRGLHGGGGGGGTSASNDDDEEDPSRRRRSASANDASTASSSSSLTSSSSSTSSSSLPMEGPTIDLTSDETELFDLLRHVTAEVPDCSAATLRVAGGWVRDKLLASPDFHRSHPYHPHHGGGSGGGGEPYERLTSKFKGEPGDGATRTTTPSANPAPQQQQQQQGFSSTGPSMGRQGTKVLTSTSTHKPVDIDVALDTLLGREFADGLNDWLSSHGRRTHSVGVVLKNPEKSKHLETATMKVGPFWIDFVNLRAEEYAADSRIPDLMRIGTPEEDAYRRDLTINALFYNVHTRRVEDWTRRGLVDLKRGIVATPLPPLTTLLDDPLRALRSVRFAARLRFVMDDDLRDAASDVRVRSALAQKVSRERVGGEVDLMLRSPDPVGAMRLLINLELIGTVFPVPHGLLVGSSSTSTSTSSSNEKAEEKGTNGDDDDARIERLFERGLALLSTTHDHLCDCKDHRPLWCEARRAARSAVYGFRERTLMDDEEARRVLWYAAFLKPMHDLGRGGDAGPHAFHWADGKKKLGGGEAGGGGGARSQKGKKANRSVVTRVMVDELKRPLRDAEAVERVMKAADDFTCLLNGGCDASAEAVLLSDVRVNYVPDDFGQDDDSATCDVNEEVEGCGSITCSMRDRPIDVETESDPLWRHAMEFRLLSSRVLQRVGSLWRAALILSLSEQLASLNEGEFDYAIEGDVIDQSNEEVRQGIVERYDAFAAALLQLGVIGIWNQKHLIDGVDITKDGALPNIPKGPVFRDVMDEQANWMTTHPGGGKDALVRHLQKAFPEFV